MKKLFCLTLVFTVILAACGTTPSIPAPSAIASLPDPTTLTYEQYNPAVTGISLEPGQSRTIKTTDDQYFTIFFAGKSDKNYVGYVTKWNGSDWSDWTEVSVTAEGSTTYETLSIEAETRPQEPCLIDTCLNTIDWYTVNFDGVRNK